MTFKNNCQTSVLECTSYRSTVITLFYLFFLTDINCQSPNKQGYFSLGTSDSLISRERLRTGTTYLYLHMLVDETRLEIQHVAFVTQSGAKIGC